MMERLERKQLIYGLMTGDLDADCFEFREAKIVADEFAEGKPCDELYQRVYSANQRLCARLGVEEDTDVEEIIGDLLQISEYLAMKMYDYGGLFSEMSQREEQITDFDISI